MNFVRLLRFSRHSTAVASDRNPRPVHPEVPGSQHGREPESTRLAGLVIVAVHAGTEPDSDQVTAAHTLLAGPDIDLVYVTTRTFVQPMQTINGNG